MADPFTIATTTTVKARLLTATGQWSGLVEATFDVMGLPGDYSGDGVVDSADFVVWRKSLDQLVTLPNDTTPGMVTQADFDVWRANFGRTAPAAGEASAMMDALTQIKSNSLGNNATDSLQAAGSNALERQSPPPVTVPKRTSTRSAVLRPVHRSTLLADSPREDALVAWLRSTFSESRQETRPAVDNGVPCEGETQSPADAPLEILDSAFASL